MTVKASAKAKPEMFAMKVIKGGLTPADGYTVSKLRARKYNIGDIVFCTMKKPRNPGFHRLAHHIGELVVFNIDSFSTCDAHSALKRIQLEGRIACDEIAYMIPSYGMVTQLVPRSLSYESMDEAEFHDCVSRMCRHISATYWPSVSPEKVLEMAECWVEPT